MSSPNQIKLEEGVYLRPTYIINSKQVVYGLYSDNYSTSQLDSYLKPKIGSTSAPGHASPLPAAPPGRRRPAGAAAPGSARGTGWPPLPPGNDRPRGRFPP